MENMIIVLAIQFYIKNQLVIFIDITIERLIKMD